MNDYFDVVDIHPALAEHSGPVGPGSEMLPGARTRNWKGGIGWLQEEVLPTHTGTVYCYQVDIKHTVRIRIKTNTHFIQLYYMIKIKGRGHLQQQDREEKFALLDERAAYLYMPDDTYIADLCPGSYLVYGFCFDPDLLFDDNAAIHPFIQPVLDAYHNHYSYMVASIDFRAEKNTRDKILELQHRLSDRKLCTALCILQCLQDLFDLSVNKILIEYENNRPDRLLADQARDKISKHFSLCDGDISVQQVADQLCVSPTRLNKVHQLHYGCNINQYRKEQRLQKAKSLLQLNQKTLEVSLHCGFVDSTSFYRSFKQETGMTPSQYRTIQRTK